MLVHIGDAAAASRTIWCDAPYPTPVHLNAFNPVPCKELREISYGSQEGLTNQDIQQQFPLEYEEFRTCRLEFRVPGGATYDEARRRMSHFVHEVVITHHSEDCGIVIVSTTRHSRFLSTGAMPCGLVSSCGT